MQCFWGVLVLNPLIRYYTRADAENAMRFINGTRLDDRIIRTDWDAGFKEGRQYGRGKSGGQVSETACHLTAVLKLHLHLSLHPSSFPSSFLLSLCLSPLPLSNLSLSLLSHTPVLQVLTLMVTQENKASQP